VRRRGAGGPVAAASAVLVRRDRNGGSCLNRAGWLVLP
jgi:hypothetical protein